MILDHPGPVEPAEAPPAPATASEPLGRNRDFKVVLLGQGISSFGDAITNTALPLLVLALTGSGFAMGIVGVLATLPDLLVGIVAGAWADRWDRRWMMLLADLGRAVLTAAIPVSAWLGGPTMAVILAVTFPLNVLRVVWLAAYTAAVPGLVGREQVARANAIFEAFYNVGWVAGPAIAGTLATLIGPGPTIAVDAASFVVSSAALFLVRRPLRAVRHGEPPRLLADMREGVAFVARHPTLRAVIGFWATVQVVLAALAASLTYHLIRERGLQPDAVGLVLSAFSVGALAGALLAARSGITRVGRVMLVGNAVQGGLLVTIALGPPVAVVAGSALIAGIASAYLLIGYLSLRTALSPDALLGRIGAVARTISVGLMPVGSLVGGILIDVIGGGRTIVVMGVLVVLATVGFGLLPGVRGAVVPTAPRRS